MMIRPIALALTLALLAGCRHEPVEEIRVNPAAANGHAATLPEVAPGDWPWWRGPTLDNHATGPRPPLEWSESENVVWKADVPGRGHASPSLWGERIFVATADEDEPAQYVLCYDRATGEVLWNTRVHAGGFMHMHQKNSQASATPACDGQSVFAVFMGDHDDQCAIWVTALDLDGNIRWQTAAGPFSTKHGYGSSPLLYDSVVIVAGDNGDTGFLTALDRQTGEIRWRVAREPLYSFASPIVAEVAGRTQLLLHGTQLVTSYNPATGDVLWQCDGPAETCANTIVTDGELVFASGGWPEKELLAVRGDGEGDVSDTHVAWKTGKGTCYVPSMLLEDGRLFAVNDNGTALCYDAKTGDVLWQKRLGGNFSASPTIVDDVIYIPDEAGKMHVFRASDEFEELAVNDLADGGFASPVIVDGQIFLRTNHHLYCIGETNSETTAGR